MSNVLKHDKRQLVLRLLSEGNSLRSVQRLTGVHTYSTSRLVVDFGKCCQNFLDEQLRNLNLRHIECDEIWTFVGKKQSRLTTEEKELSGTLGDVYVWTAIDQDSKLLVTYALGKRTADMARRFMVDLAGRLVWPSPHESDAHAYQPEGYRTITQISTDGFAGYPEAVDLAFGPYAKFGVIIKEFRNAAMDYVPSEMVGTKRRVVKGEFDERSICTSHVERHNLTIRTFMKRFARLSLGFSKKFECLAGAVAIFAAYYNFLWRSRYPDNSGRPGKRRTPAAMLAGITDHLWNFDELYHTVIQYG